MRVRRYFKEWNLATMVMTFLLMAGSIRAQNEIPGSPNFDLPQPPYVAEFAPEFSQWQIVFGYGGEKSSASNRATAPTLDGARIEQMHNVKTGVVTFERRTFVGGATQDKWSDDGVEVLQTPRYEELVVRPNVRKSGDFVEFEWIEAANYVGRQTVEGRICDVFRTELYALQFADPGLFKAVMEMEDRGSVDMGSKIPVAAYVDVESRMPARLEVGQDWRDYTFLARPTAKLSMPKDYQDAARKVAERLQALTRPLSRP